jgi:hypothetical protein
MKKGSKRQSGVERQKNYFEDVVSSKKFLNFAKQMEKDYEELRAHRFNDVANHFELENYWNSFSAWDEKVYDFCLQNGLDPSDFYPLVSIILRHGKYGWLRVTDQEMLKIGEKHSQNNCFPVLLEISPYATRNNILEFIERNYTPKIEPIQEKHRKKDVNLDKVRSKRTKLRDDYICKLSFEGKKRKEIVDLINDQFPGVIGYEDISNILKKKK